MKFEEFKKPIETQSIEEHEKILEEKMTEIQLEYIDKLAQEKILPFNETLEEKVDVKDIGVLLSKCTWILQELKHQYDSRTSDGFDKNARDLFQQKIVDTVSIFFKEDHKNWIEKTEEFIKNEIEKLGPIQKKEKQDNNQDIKKIGLIEFGIEDNLGHLLPNSNLEDSPYVSIHFPELYKQKDNDVKNLFSVNLSKSLGELAQKIIDKYPETKAIVGESWLMSTPVAQRIGFTIIDHNSKRGLGGQFWGQFINSTGQIDNERVSKFLKTGEPPYKVSTGVMMIEDFLRKYLPEEKRGKIILKDLNQSFNKEFKKESETAYKIFENWDKSIEEDIGKIFFENKIFGDFLKTQEGEEFDLLLKNFKKDKKTKEEVKEDKKFIEYRKSFLQFVNKKKFVDREVVI
jgi:hypothetical protein